MIDYLSPYSDSPIKLLLAALALFLALVLSLSFHEYAHAYVAYKNGDDTAKIAGRLTMNPLKHMDVLGIICCMLFSFGWAKPVPINSLKFRNYKKGMATVSLAGITVNFIFAFIFGGLSVLFMRIQKVDNILFFIDLFSRVMFQLNVCLFVFNLLPIYPLDGFNFITAFTKYDNRYVQFMYKYGSIILLIILLCFSWIITNLIYLIMYPILTFWELIF